MTLHNIFGVEARGNGGFGFGEGLREDTICACYGLSEERNGSSTTRLAECCGNNRRRSTGAKSDVESVTVNPEAGNPSMLQKSPDSASGARTTPKKLNVVPSRVLRPLCEKLEGVKIELTILAYLVISWLIASNYSLIYACLWTDKISLMPTQDSQWCE